MKFRPNIFAIDQAEGSMHVWYVEKLWKASAELPIKEVAIQSIAGFDEVCWFSPDGQSPTCRNVAQHAQRIQKANVDEPIILSASGRVMDGMHRVAKAWVSGATTIRAVQFAVDPPPDEIVQAGVDAPRHGSMNETVPCLVRRAEANDAPFIESLYRELVDDPNIRVVPEQIAAQVDSPTSLLLVVEVDDAVCATALLTICPDVMYGSQPFGIIENIIVTKAKRGLGIGRRLLAHLEQLATAQDCTKLILTSHHTRDEAHAFFQRCGFAGDTKRAFVKYRRQFSTESNFARE